MDALIKSIIVGVLLVLGSALLGGIGVAVLILKPFGELLTGLSAASLIGSACIAWGWACFARKELYE